MRPDEALADLADHPPEEIDRVCVSRRGLREFSKLAWAEVEADALVWSWHLDQICNHLEAVSRGELRRLIINVPPGCTKSKLVSVLWPAWDWIAHPTRKWMFATFDAALTFRDANDCRKIVRSDWFRDRWGRIVEIDDGGEVQATQSVYHTLRGGRRVSVTVGAGKATGWHAGIQVIDDPTKPKDVTGDPDIARGALERTIRWFKTTMGSRRTGANFSRVIIMQRLHEEDLVGHLLENDKAHEWTHLMLPMRYEPDRACRTAWGGDIRTREGELLVPDRFDEKSVQELERDLGSQAASAQLQQRPAPAGGNVFKREWFSERWTALPADLMLVQSWDCAFKDTAGADYVAGHVWGYAKGKFYLVDRIHDRMGLPETCNCLLALMRRHPRARGKLIEDKANGPAVEQTLRGRVSGIVMVTPEGGKVARANAIAPLAEAKNIILPEGSIHPWADEVLEEIVSFPFARHDDDVDAMTQAIIYLHDHSNARYLEAMKKVAQGKVNIGT